MLDKLEEIRKTRKYENVVRWLTTLNENEKMLIQETMRTVDSFSGSLFDDMEMFDYFVSGSFYQLEKQLSKLHMRHPAKTARRAQVLSTLTYTLKPFELTQRCAKDDSQQVYSIARMSHPSPVFHEGNIYVQGGVKTEFGTMISVANTEDHTSPDYRCFYVCPKDNLVCLVNKYGNSSAEIDRENLAATYLNSIFNHRSKVTAIFERSKDPKMLALLEDTLGYHITTTEAKEEMATEKSIDVRIKK